MRIGAVVGLTLCLSLTSALCARAQDGEAVFRANCATCHGDPNGPSPVSAPTVAALRRSTPESILNALVNGKMRIQGTPLDDAARRAVAEFLGGRPLHNPLADAAVVRCASPFPPFRGDTEEGDWNGWGNGLGNTRFARRGGLTAAELPRLKLKWAFGYADVTSARAQPALVGNRLFVASDSGEVHALDPRTGCAYWSFRAQATVRTALLVAPYRTPEGGRGWAVFFGDLRANAYALDATSGRPIWNRKADEHPFAAITGALTFHDGRVFVPVQGLNEEVQGGRPQYRVLYLPRQCVRAGCEHWRCRVEDLYRWRPAVARDERRRRITVGACWRRDLGRGDRGRPSRRSLRRHRQRLRRPASADDGRRHRARSQDGHDTLVAPAHAE